MENQQVTHTYLNSRYRVVFERGATKGIIGYKVEANGDDINQTFMDAKKLMEAAEQATPISEVITK